MICEVKVNSIKYLEKKGAINDVRRVEDIQLFDELNDSLTKYAEEKYGLVTDGVKLFTIQYEQVGTAKAMPYYRTNGKTIPRAIPNETLFNNLQTLMKQEELKPAIPPAIAETKVSKSYPTQLELVFEEAGIPVVEMSLQTLKDARSKQAAEMLIEKLAISMGVNYYNITSERATELLKSRQIPYKGEPSFYFAGAVYIVGDNINMHTVMHEFAHPLLQVIKRDNPKLFNNLYAQLKGTGEGEGILNYVRTNYPELKEDSGLFMEEALAYALQLRAINITNKQIETQGFDKFIKNLLYAIRQMLKGIYGPKVKVSDINVDTPLDTLAERMLSDQFQLDIPDITQDDLVRFAKFSVEGVDILTENASAEAVNKAINSLFLSNMNILNEAREFMGDKVTKKIVQESIFRQGTTELTEGIRSSLSRYQTVTRKQDKTVEEVITDTLEAEKLRITELNNQAVALVNSLAITDTITKNIVKELNVLSKKNFTTEPNIALINLYKGIIRRMYSNVTEIDNILRSDFNLTSENAFTNLLNEITRNTIRATELIKTMGTDITESFYVEITGYMSDFMKKELRTDLGNTLKNKLTPEEIEDFANKVIQQRLEDSDMEALGKKGVEVKYINKFVERYNKYVVDAPKIRAVLEGKTRDIGAISRYLESYSSSNNPLVGSVAMWIQNQRTEAEQRVWKRAMEFKSSLEKLLPAVNFNKSNTRQLLDMLTFEDEVMTFNKQTGKPEKKKIYSFLNEHGNGWRYELESKEFAVFEARKAGDVAAIKAAEIDLRNFKRDYMYDEYLPEVYEKDQIFSTEEHGDKAWLARKQALDNYNNEVSKLHNETERFENYTQVQAAWQDYQQLYSLRYEDGTLKVDDPANNIYDKSIAEILIKHREGSRDFYEFIAIPGSLQTAYNEFASLLEAQDIPRDSEEFDKKIKEWTKQNTRVLYSENYYNEKKRLLTRLRELQGKLKSDFDTSEAFTEIFDLLHAYRDEQGQPNAALLTEEKLLRIQALQKDIIKFRKNFDRGTGMTKDQLAELSEYTNMHKNDIPLSPEQKDRYLYLSDLKLQGGLTAHEIVEMDNLISDLGDLSTSIPTEYYMDQLNYNLSKHNIKAKTVDEVDEYINSDEFAEIVKSDDNFLAWYRLNHITKEVYKKGFKKPQLVDERTYANSVSIPKDNANIVTTDIIDTTTGKTVTIKGVPNARHSYFRIKDRYRTVPFGLTAEERQSYVGTVIDNKGNYLPRPYTPGAKNSAKDSRFINQAYQSMKLAGGAKFELLEAIKAFHLETQKGKANYSKLYYDMPRYVLKGIVESVQSGKYGDTMGQVKENITEWFKQKFGRSVQDMENEFNYNAENNLVNTDLNGNEVSYIPVSGLYKLDTKIADPDVIGNIIRYALSVENQSQLFKTLPLIETVIDTISDPAAQPKNLDAYSRDIKMASNELKHPNKKYAENNMMGQLQSLIQREYYGVDNSSVSESYPVLTKFLSTLQGASAMGSLAINIPSDLKNKYAGMIQLIIEAAGAEFVNMKDLAQGRAFSFKAMTTWSSFGNKGIYAIGPGALTTQLVQVFDPAFKGTDQLGKSVSRHIWKDLVNGDWMYMHRKFGEMEVALTLFGAMLNAEKVEQKLSDGTIKVIKYVDAWEQDANGILVLKPGIHPSWSNQSIYHEFAQGEKLADVAKQYGVTVQEILDKNKIKDEIELKDGQRLVISKAENFMATKNKIQGLSRALFGAYDKFGQAEGDKYLMYRMFFFMRKWFTPMLINRFGVDMSPENKWGERYDWALGTTRKGFYVQAFQTLASLIKERGKNYKYLSTKEKVAMRKAGMEGLMIIGLSLLASMVFGFDEDDPDKWKKLKAKSTAYTTDDFQTWGFIENHMLALLLGIQSETSAFVPLPKIGGVNLGADDLAKMLTSTTTAFGNTLLLYYEILADVLNILTFNEASKYKRDAGPYSWEEKGDSKIIAHLMKAFGATGSTGDPESVIKNLVNSASRIGK